MLRRVVTSSIRTSKNAKRGVIAPLLNYNNNNNNTRVTTNTISSSSNNSNSNNSRSLTFNITNKNESRYINKRTLYLTPQMKVNVYQKRSYASLPSGCVYLYLSLCVCVCYISHVTNIVLYEIFSV